MNNVPMLNTYCRRCRAAILSTAVSCPLCGLNRPNYDKLTKQEKHYVSNPPSFPEKYENSIEQIDAKKSYPGEFIKVYMAYLSSGDSSDYKIAGIIALASLVTSLAANATKIFFIAKLSYIFLALSMAFILFDSFCLLRFSYKSFVAKRIQMQSGTSPYSVHLKIENVLYHELKNLQSLLTSFYEKPWDELRKEMDTNVAGDTFIQAAKAISSKIIKFAKISLETFTLLWRNNIYAITSYSDLNMDDKITSLNIKIREAEAFILRYCWFNQFKITHEFIEATLAGTSGRSQEDDREYVISGMQLNPMGPLSEPFQGNIEGAPFELQFIMRYFWHQQLRPGELPSQEIIAEFPETSEIFESISQLKNLIRKLEEQKLINSATSAISGFSSEENKITVEARQIKNFELYSQYLDIPKFQTNDEELHKRIDQLNAQIRI